MDTQERNKKINELKEEYKEVEEFWKDKDSNDFNPFAEEKDKHRIERHIELLKQGVEVEPVLNNGTNVHYFLVNGKFIVPTQKNKWRIKGKGKWYWFKNISDFVEKYVKKNNYRQSRNKHAILKRNKK